MLNLGQLAFANPWMLLALATLPAIWWLLRAIPPAPRRIPFPAIRLLRGLQTSDETPSHTPWWLVLVRLVLAALVILGLAQPVLSPGGTEGDKRLLILVVDDGWAAAPRWDMRQAAMGELIEQMDRADGQVLLLPTAEREAGSPLAAQLPSQAMAAVRVMQPKPWHLDRAAAAKRLQDARLTPEQRDNALIVWLSDGLTDIADAEGAAALIEGLRRFGRIRLVTDGPDYAHMILGQPEPTSSGFDLRVLRAGADEASLSEVRIFGADGRILATEKAEFPAGATAAGISMQLPVALRNVSHHIALKGVNSAAAVWLLDERWRRRTVGLASGGGLKSTQPLLDDLFYLERAMSPFAEVRTGTIADLLGNPLSMLVLADIGQIVGEDRARVEAWVNGGGVLARFAGPRMAENTDDLIPVRLRRGGRAFGGALSWDAPAGMAPFQEESPFFALPVPEEVKITRQILAEPEPGLAERTWASLEDGTPLVTAERRGKGWIVLFHVTANARWSNLPLSGLYVGMLRRVSELALGVEDASGITADTQRPLDPLLALDGRGRLVAPSSSAQPVLPDAKGDSMQVGPKRPPGYYGTPERQFAVNLDRGPDHLQPLDGLPSDTVRLSYGPRRNVELRPWFLSAAMLLLLADGVIALGLLGRLPGGFRLARTGANLLLIGAFFLVAPMPQARAGEQSPASERRLLDAALETRLAYIRTGDQDTDAVSLAGLRGLTQVLRLRTAFEPGAPVGVDPEHDSLTLYPLIYWPMSERQVPLSDRALAQIDAYMKNGGTLLFDTRDQLTAFGTPGQRMSDRIGSGRTVLQEILGALDVPPLIPVPVDHVISKSYYLLPDFPGRHVGGRVWLEASAVSGASDWGREDDRVSGILIGSNDWAAAWAVDESGRPLIPLGPSGTRQRELAYRVGVNFVMYALTGNYKADQVHVPALLERLGQ